MLKTLVDKRTMWWHDQVCKKQNTGSSQSKSISKIHSVACDLLMQTFTFLQFQFKTSASDLRCHQKAALFRTLLGWCCSGSSCLLADKQLDPSGHCHHIEFSSVFGGKPILKIKVVLLEKYLSLFILLSFKSKNFRLCNL